MRYDESLIKVVSHSRKSASNLKLVAPAFQSFVPAIDYICHMVPCEFPQKIYHGRNVKRFRETLGIKHEALAAHLGNDWSQKTISLLQAKETIEPALLDELAQALKVPAEALKNFSAETAINIISNTFNNHDYAAPQFANAIHYSPSFNPADPN